MLRRVYWEILGIHLPVYTG